MLKRFGGGIKKWSSTYANAAKYNGQLKVPSMMKPEREEVFTLYKEGYEKVEREREGKEREEKEGGRRRKGMKGMNEERGKEKEKEIILLLLLRWQPLRPD